jgi:hypothetical protein
LFDAFPAIRNGFCGIDHGRPIGELPDCFRLTGANMAFRVAAIQGLRFDPALGVSQTSLGGGEETTFISAVRGLGGTVVWVPAMRLRHYVDPGRMELSYLIRLSRDRGRSGVRAHGVPPGRRLAGAPLWLWVRFFRAFLKAAMAWTAGRKVRAAGHWAKSESYRAKIIESRRLLHSSSPASRHKLQPGLKHSR